jgi:hypothetical protein
VSGPLAALLRTREWRQDARFEEACRDPEAAQRRVLQGLLARHAATGFGREHGLAPGMSPAAFAAAVPIRDYEGHRPWIARQLAGEPAVLTAAPPVMYTTTSGTTGEPKLIPVPYAWREETAGLMRLWMKRVLADHPRAFARKTLSIVSPAVEGHAPNGLPIGSMSGVTYQRIPWLVRRAYALPYAVALVKDHEARYFLTMRLALAANVSSLATPNATTLMRLAGVGFDRTEEILRAIHDGVPGPAAPPEMVTAGGHDARALWEELRAAVRPDPERARALARRAEVHGGLRPRDAWPELRLVACWLGGSAGHHARRLGEWYGPATPLRDLGLLASEGRMTVPLADGTPGGALALHTSYFEFVAEDEIEAAAPRVALAHELEAGRRYYLIFTSGNGLYRYDMNDVVEVLGHHHRAPVVAFVRKGRDMASITGEKIHLNQVQAALREAEAALGRPVWQFQLVPDVAACRYDLLVEASDEPPDLAALGAAFDAALGRLNAEYASKRASGRLGAPRVHLMAPGWSERACRAAFEAGKRDFQFKWPALAAAWAPGFADEVVRSGPGGGLAEA